MTAIDPTINQTSDRINDAAIELFHQHGYNATSLRQIAQRVGVQVGSLYNHFDSKDSLLFRLMQEIMEDLIAETRAEMAAAGDDPVGHVLAFMRCSIRFHTERRQQTFIGNTELRALSSERRRAIIALRDEYESMLREALRRAGDAGLLRIDDLRMATLAALAICTSVANWYREDGRLSVADLQELLPQMFGPLANGGGAVSGSAA